MIKTAHRPWVFVDCEARGTSPVNGILTEFGAVHFDTRASFYGQLYESSPDPENPAIPVVGQRIQTDLEVATDFTDWLRVTLNAGQRPVLVSDNPAYDFMWVAGLFDSAGLDNPFGHSGRRISDYWAGLNCDWGNTQGWKKFRKTAHDHHPVHDAMGNVEAFEQILSITAERKAASPWRPWEEGSTAL